MKIFFEAGQTTLDSACSIHKQCHVTLVEVDAGDGYYAVRGNLDGTLACWKDGQNVAVYTNSVLALDNRYCWNEKEGICELYLKHGGEWTRVDKITKRELRQGHNLFNLFVSGELQGCLRKDGKLWRIITTLL